MRYKETTTLDLLKECDYIVSRALAGKNAIIMIACLVFTAYEGGDAFALDLDDNSPARFARKARSSDTRCLRPIPSGCSNGPGTIT